MSECTFKHGFHATGPNEMLISTLKSMIERTRSRREWVSKVIPAMLVALIAIGITWEAMIIPALLAIVTLLTYYYFARQMLLPLPDTLILVSPYQLDSEEQQYYRSIHRAKRLGG